MSSEDYYNYQMGTGDGSVGPTDSDHSIVAAMDSVTGSAIPAYYSSYRSRQLDVFSSVSARTQALLGEILIAGRFVALYDVPMQVWQELLLFCNQMIAHENSSIRGMLQPTVGNNDATPSAQSYLTIPSAVHPSVINQHPFVPHTANLHQQWASISQVSIDTGFGYGDADASTVQPRAGIQTPGPTSSGVLHDAIVFAYDAYQGLDTSHTLSYTASANTYASPSTPADSGYHVTNAASVHSQTFNVASGHARPLSIALSPTFTTSNQSSTPATTHGPIRCGWWPQCYQQIASASEIDIKKHLREKHFCDISTKEAPCGWGDCSSLKKFKLASLPRHIMSHHLKSGRKRCAACKTDFSRDDALRRHAKKCRYAM